MLTAFASLRGMKQYRYGCSGGAMKRMSDPEAAAKQRFRASTKSASWCRGEDSNLHGIAPVSS